MSVIMDSSHFHQPAHLHRVHTLPANASLHPIDHRGAIRKRTAPRHRSISNSQVERLHQLASEHAHQTPANSLPSPAVVSQWLTPQPSPQPHIFPAEASVDTLPHWTVPTPPKSDAGAHAVTFEATDIPVTSALSSADFSNFEPTTASAEMSSLGFLLPSQYGSTGMESEPAGYAMDQNYIPPVRVSQSVTASAAPAYAQTISSSPALYQNKPIPVPSSGNRRPSEASLAANSESSYSQNYRRPSNSYDSLSNTEYSIATNQTIPSISGLHQNPMPSPSARSASGSAVLQQYHPSASRSPNVYDAGLYGQQQFTAAPSTAQLYASTHNLNYPPPFVGSSVNEVLAKPLGSESSIRLLNQRPKPQCWEHGCGGRQFSTFSNLLRHQREKSGTAAKSYCPKCGAEFTRTTARNGHLAHDKCTKQRRPSEEK